LLRRYRETFFKPLIFASRTGVQLLRDSAMGLELE